jgi:hypothetical protein
MRPKPFMPTFFIVCIVLLTPDGRHRQFTSTSVATGKAVTYEAAVHIGQQPDRVQRIMNDDRLKDVQFKKFPWLPL